jgi:hypothetical protein
MSFVHISFCVAVLLLIHVCIPSHHCIITQIVVVHISIHVEILLWLHRLHLGMGMLLRRMRMLLR